MKLFIAILAVFLFAVPLVLVVVAVIALFWNWNAIYSDHPWEEKPKASTDIFPAIEENW
jgi:multidrug resistance efflux pump